MYKLLHLSLLAVALGYHHGPISSKRLCVKPSRLATIRSVGLNTPSFAEAQQDLQSLKEKMERLEKQWATLMSTPLPASDDSVPTFMATLRANTNALDIRTIELCAMCAFFVVGWVLGSSVFELFGIVGGAAGAYWASGAVNHDTRSGALVRNVGFKVAQIVVYLRMKWNELVVFYRTGKLAFLGKAQYEKLDNRFAIEKRIAEFKRLSMVRIAELGQRDVPLVDQVADFWRVLRNEVSEPEKLKKRGLLIFRQVREELPKIKRPPAK